MTAADVAIAIVTHNDATDLVDCLDAVARLDPAPCELVIVDCASHDGSRQVARESWPEGLDGETVSLEENRGFAGGMNEAIGRSRAAWVLTLNADARPATDYLGCLLGLATAASPRKVGAVTGRLTRPPVDGTTQVDAAGMRLVPTWRHLDRGSGTPDRGQLSRPEWVFGGTGAATLFRREALVDVALEGYPFDPLFHTFREDAELCFRLCERGWEILYAPAAACLHRRFSLPSRRHSMPATVNYHSLKNRYLLRIYHQTMPNLLWTFPFTLWRDALALGWVVLAERSSLDAYAWLWRHRRELVERRRTVQAQRTEPWWRLDRWFLRSARPFVSRSGS